MRIVHILSNAHSGGASKACFRIHEAMLKSGKVNSSILMLDQPPKDLENSYHFYEFHKSSHKSFFEKFTTKVRFLLGLSYENFVSKHKKIQRQIITKKKPGIEVFTFPISNYDLTSHPEYQKADIVHLHWVSNGYIDFHNFFGKNKKPVCWTLHDMNPFTGGCHFSDSCQRFIYDCKPCPELKDTGFENYAAEMLSYKKKYLAGKSLTIISPSNWLLRESKKSKLFSRYKHYRISYPINEKIFFYIDKAQAKKKLGLNSTKFHLLFSAYNLQNRRKGLDLLINALNLFSENELNMEILVIGKGDSIHEMSNFNVKNLGFVSSDEKLAEIYQAANLFVIPTIADNLPNVVLESLMCGTPVLGFNIGGLPDMVRKENGILIDEISSVGIKKGLEQFYSQANSYNYQAIAEDAKEKYSYPKILDQYVQVYEEILNDKK